MFRVPFRYRIVRTPDGKYAVRKFKLFSGYVYIDKNGMYGWLSTKYIQKYCAVDTIEEAREIRQQARHTFELEVIE